MTAKHESYEELMAGMQSVQGELAPLNEETARIEAERREILKRAVAELGDKALGQTITATNITGLRNWQVLQPFKAHNAAQASGLAPSLRTYEGARDNYFNASPLRNPGSVTGEVVGIDVLRTSLVLKPKVLRRIGGASRYWIVLMDKNGTPLVRLADPEDETDSAE